MIVVQSMRTGYIFQSRKELEEDIERTSQWWSTAESDEVVRALEQLEELESLRKDFDLIDHITERRTQ